MARLELHAKRRLTSREVFVPELDVVRTFTSLRTPKHARDLAETVIAAKREESAEERTKAAETSAELDAKTPGWRERDLLARWRVGH